jgi:hypothetical protein
MTNAWFLGATFSVPQSEAEARSTVEPIRHDNQDAEADSAPDFNELDTDESGELVGLSPREVGSYTVDIEKYDPWWAGLATAEHNNIIDRQVASSGTAAAREVSGQQGHGTMQYAEGIEPELRDGIHFGNDYFVFAQTNIQDGMGDYMSPGLDDAWVNIAAQADAIGASRKAYQSTNWGNLFAGS